MYSYFIPHSKNQNRAKLLRIPFLILFTFVIFFFNFGVGLKIDTSASDASDSISVDNLLYWHNIERKKNGLTELQISPLLTQSAQSKAQAMLDSNCWDHYCPNGKSPWDFFKAVNYDYVFAGENLAEGFYDIDTLMQAWMNSPTHKANVIKEGYTEVGFGIVYGKFQGNSDNVIVTVHFGTPKSSVVLVQNNDEFYIKNPVTGATFNTSDLTVSGNTGGFDKIYIVKDGVIDGQANVNEGIFTYDLTGLSNGEHSLFASGYLNNGVEKRSNTVSISVVLPVGDQLGESIETVKFNSLVGLNVTPGQKNIINLIFVLFLALLFLIDFLVLSRTHVLERNRTFSHFNFVILLIVALVIITGGYSGEIGKGLVS